MLAAIATAAQSDHRYLRLSVCDRALYARTSMLEAVPRSSSKLEVYLGLLPRLTHLLIKTTSNSFVLRILHGNPACSTVTALSLPYISHLDLSRMAAESDPIPFTRVTSLQLGWHAHQYFPHTMPIDPVGRAQQISVSTASILLLLIASMHGLTHCYRMS